MDEILCLLRHQQVEVVTYLIVYYIEQRALLTEFLLKLDVPGKEITKINLKFREKGLIRVMISLAGNNKEIGIKKTMRV